MSDEERKAPKGADIPTLTVEILREIRDETRQVKEETQRLGVRLDAQTERLDAHGERLDRLSEQMGRQTEAMVRGFTAVREELSSLNGRIDNVFFGEHGREHQSLRERVTRLEQRVGMPTE